MYSYLFYDDGTGEDFIVEADSKKEAYEIAIMYFDFPQCKGRISESEAEWLGLDTY